MSYTLPLHNLLYHYLNEFYEEYGTELSEEDVHHKAPYFTYSTKVFIDSPTTLANIISDPVYLNYLDDEMHYSHYKFTTLCNAALSKLVYTYIIENY